LEIERNYLNFQMKNSSILEIHSMDEIKSTADIVLLEKILDHNSANDIVYEWILRNPNCTVEILEKIYKKTVNNNFSCCYFIQQLIAENINCPIYILEEFIDDKNDIVVERVLKNPNCPEYLLKKKFDSLFSINDISVKSIFNSSKINFAYALASNINCPIEYLKYFIKINYIFLQRYVLSNENCPANLIEEFSNNISYHNSIIQNKNCSHIILKKIYKIWKGNSIMIFKIENHRNWKFVDFI